MTASVIARPALVTDGRTDLITMLLATWLMVGLFLDGYAHTSLIDELESFFTPWHGVFYSGFLATAAWVTWIVYKNVRRGLAIREAIPAGYGPTVVGLSLFALGGVGDGIWHTVFGVEAGIDALLSPTHFMLFLGGVLGLSTAIRTTRVRNQGDDVDPTDRTSLILSLLLTTAAIAFFSAYMWMPGQPFILEQAYNPGTGTGQGAVAFFIAGMLVSTAVLLAPVLILLRRWRPPTGTVAVIWIVINIAIAISFDMHLGVATAFGLAGGLTGEAMVIALDPGPSSRTMSLVMVAVLPVAAWSTYMIVVASIGILRWPPEIWAGSVVLSGLAGAGLGWLALPEPVELRSG